MFCFWMAAVSGSLTSSPCGKPPALSLLICGQGIRENVSYLSQLPISKMKECHLPDCTQLCASYVPSCQILQVDVFCQDDSHQNSAEVTEQIFYYLLGLWVYSPWDLSFQYMREWGVNWVTGSVTSSHISNCTVAERAEVLERYCSTLKRTFQKLEWSGLLWEVVSPICRDVSTDPIRRQWTLSGCTNL